MLRLAAWLSGFVLLCASTTALAGPCAFLVKTDAGIKRIDAPGFELSNQRPLRLPAGAENAVGLICERGDLVLQDQDISAIADLNLVTYLHTKTQTVVLEVSGGQLRVRFIEGNANPEQLSAIQLWLDKAQLALRAEHDRRAGDEKQVH